MSNDIVLRAKLLQEAKKAQADQLISSRSMFDLSKLSEKDLYMRMSLLSLSLWEFLKHSSYVKFSTLFKQRGLCPRSRQALRISMEDREQLQALREQLHTLTETVDSLLSPTEQE